MGRIALRDQRMGDAPEPPLDRHHVHGLARLLQHEAASEYLADRARVQSVRAHAAFPANLVDLFGLAYHRAVSALGAPDTRSRDGTVGQPRAGDDLRVHL